MPSAYEKLDKILRLELSRECEDKAVIGGLDHECIVRGKANQGVDVTVSIIAFKLAVG